MSPKYDIEHVEGDYGQIRMRAAEDLKEILTVQRVEWIVKQFPEVFRDVCSSIEWIVSGWAGIVIHDEMIGRDQGGFVELSSNNLLRGGNTL